jgi:outer membrane receptor protein involved in Fe transport
MARRILKNSSREKVRLARARCQPSADFAWHGVAYAQDQTFASTFSGVNATRTARHPPAISSTCRPPRSARGGRGCERIRCAHDVRCGYRATSAARPGKNFTFTNGAFTGFVSPAAGSSSAEFYVLHERSLSEQLRATIGARGDAWSENRRHAAETDRNNGTVFRDDHYADRDGTSFSPSAGLIWSPIRHGVGARISSRVFAGPRLMNCTGRFAPAPTSPRRMPPCAPSASHRRSWRAMDALRRIDTPGQT